MSQVNIPLETLPYVNVHLRNTQRPNINNADQVEILVQFSLKSELRG